MGDEPMRLLEERIKKRVGFVWNTMRVEVILTFTAIICLIFASVILFSTIKSSDQNTVVEEISTETDPTPQPKKIVIDISGSVEKPNAVELPEGSRLKDSLISVGGLSSKADRAYFARNFNLAEVLSDQQKIYIPSVEEVKTGLYPEKRYASTAKGDGQIRNSPSYVNINMATKSELESLTGVGPVTAEKIINNRPYADLSELLLKKAVGSSLYEKIKESITL